VLGDLTLDVLLAADDHSPADDRLLDAAREMFTLVGIKRTSTDDIARRAEVNRVTLYRRLGSKDQIIRAVLLRELARLLTRIRDETAAIEDFAERVVRAFVVTVTLFRDNVLLRQSLALDPEESLIWLTRRFGPALDLSVGFVAHHIRLAREEAGLPPVRDESDLDALAAIMVRFIHSLILTPDAPPRLDTPEQLHAFADRHLRPLIVGLT